MYFRSETHLEDFQESLLGSLLTFNALSLLAVSSLTSSGVQTCLYGGMTYISFVYDLFCNLYVYYFSCKFFCKFEKILMNFFGKYVHVYHIILPKVLEIIDTILIAKHNNTKN